WTRRYADAGVSVLRDVETALDRLGQAAGHADLTAADADGHEVGDLRLPLRAAGAGVAARELALGDGHRCRLGLVMRAGPSGLRLALGCVAAAELLHATRGVEDLLLARVERVRGRGDVDVDHRVGVAVLPLDGLRRGQRGPRQDREVRGDVAEHDRRVLRVDVLLHDCRFLGSALVRYTQVPFPMRGAAR